ncbi:MAG: AbrB/MazE/SpoVT family DNA-binding domain-containing protein [Chloroflexota bacterium]|nr:AbrB/MazE/SpoVT family DNA-binding domain-containing protein [Chloroflexota bacterium]
MKEGTRMTRLVRPLRSGQITIPADFRKQLDIQEDSLLQMTLEGDELRIKKVQVSETAAAAPWLKELHDRFAPVREEAKGYSEAEINEAIDAAVTAVRRCRA